MPILRHACRSIRRTPLLASVIVSSLGIGIGANAVVFSWIEPAVLRPIAGVKKSSSLYWIEPRTDTGSYPGASWREFQDLGDRLRTLRDLLAFRMLPLYLCESGRVERAYGLLVSGNYFSALGRRWDDFSLQRMSRIPVIRRSSSSLMSSGRRGSRAVLMRWDDRFESTAAKSPSLVSRRAAFTVRCRVWRSIPSCRSTI